MTHVPGDLCAPFFAFLSYILREGLQKVYRQKKEGENRKTHEQWKDKKNGTYNQAGGTVIPEYPILGGSSLQICLDQFGR